MSTLLLQQQQFVLALKNNDANAAQNLLLPTPQGTPARLNIYSNAYIARLTEALKENYPVLARVLGDEAFEQLASSFIAQYPSHHFSIRWFGAHLFEFGKAFPEALIHPALQDLIAMEWALSCAFDAKDDTPLGIQDFINLTPEQWQNLTLQTHPSISLLALNWNVAPLWHTLTADENAETQPPEALEHHLLVWRQDGKNRWRSVVAIEALLWQLTKEGATFSALCELAEKHQFGADTVASYLRIWVEAGMITGAQY